MSSRIWSEYYGYEFKKNHFFQTQFNLCNKAKQVLCVKKCMIECYRISLKDKLSLESWEMNSIICHLKSLSFISLDTHFPFLIIGDLGQSKKINTIRPYSIR